MQQATSNVNLTPSTCSSQPQSPNSIDLAQLQLAANEANIQQLAPTPQVISSAQSLPIGSQHQLPLGTQFVLPQGFFPIYHMPVPSNLCSSPTNHPNVITQIMSCQAAKQNNEKVSKHRGKKAGRGRGGTAKESGQQSEKTKKPNRSWIKDFNSDGKSSLDAIVDWLTTDENYELWRSGTKSKREVCEIIVQYLKVNGFTEQTSKGVEQQIQGLEAKYRLALQWRDQTGQGILDEADRAEKECANGSDDEEANDVLKEAQNKTEAEIRKCCPYFYELDPIMGNRPSARPLFQAGTSGKENAEEMACALGVMRNHQSQNLEDNDGNNKSESPEIPIEGWEETPPPSNPLAASDAQDGKGQSNHVRIDHVTPTLKRHTSNTLADEDPDDKGWTPKRKKGKESLVAELTKGIVPTKEERERQMRIERDLADTQINLGSRIAKTDLQLVGSVCMPSGYRDPQKSQEMMELELREKELAIRMNEHKFKETVAQSLQNEGNMAHLESRKVKLDIKQRKLEIEQMEAKKKSHAAQERAAMICQFFSAGLSLEQATSMTDSILGPMGNVQGNI